MSDLRFSGLLCGRFSESLHGREGCHFGVIGFPQGAADDMSYVVSGGTLI